ncbi:MAG: biopolymer transporter ExbD [Elusimicrobiota bacterium]|jgi:biopolymer transport protein ExbD|nr:biopolymer transporter ExbD [Elusimicrobiota bacterium]
MRRAKRNRNKVVSEINITPFTDVVLVLLIIFMITTPMLMQPSLDVNLPKAQETNLADNTNIDVLITKDGSAIIEGRQIHRNNIESEIRNLIIKTPNRPVIIKGDKDAKYDFIIDFMNRARQAGAVKFALAVDNKGIGKPSGNAVRRKL